MYLNSSDDNLFMNIYYTYTYYKIIVNRCNDVTSKSKR